MFLEKPVAVCLRGVRQVLAAAEYAGGVKLTSWCRQIDGCANRIGEEVRGTKGIANPAGSIQGETNWQFKGKAPNPYVQEHADLLQSIRIGQPVNEGQQVAYSTLSAIMGRMAAYTGKEVTWKFALEESQLDRRPPAKLELGARPVDPELSLCFQGAGPRRRNRLG